MVGSDVFAVDTNNIASTSSDNTGVEQSKGDYLSTLVGEGKHFKSVEDLAKGKSDADAYIEQLKVQNQLYKEQLEKASKIDDVLEKLKEKKNTFEDTNVDYNNKPVESKTDTSLKDIDLNKLIEQKLSEQSTKQAQEQNLSLVNKVLNDTYGDKAAEVLKEKAAELNVSVDFLKGVAIHSPSGFLKMVGVNTPSTTPQKNINGTVNTQAMSLTIANNPKDALTDFRAELAKGPQGKRNIMSREFQNAFMDKAIAEEKKKRGL